MRARFPVFVLFTVLVVAIGLLGCSGKAEAKAAPDWSLKGLDGKTVKLSDFKGKIVVLNFWATWCPPCLEEIPDFISLQREYQAKGVVVIGISVDSIQPSDVAAFAKKIGINYQIVMSTDEVREEYGAIEGVPDTYIIAPNGKLAAAQQGIVDREFLQTQVKKLLPSVSK